MPKLNFKTVKVRYIARCLKCDYHSPSYRDTEKEAYDDALNHISKPGNKDHEVEVTEEYYRNARVKK